MRKSYEKKNKRPGHFHIDQGFSKRDALSAMIRLFYFYQPILPPPSAGGNASAEWRIDRPVALVSWEPAVFCEMNSFASPAVCGSLRRDVTGDSLRSRGYR